MNIKEQQSDDYLPTGESSNRQTKTQPPQFDKHFKMNQIRDFVQNQQIAEKPSTNIKNEQRLKQIESFH